MTTRKLGSATAQKLPAPKTIKTITNTIAAAAQQLIENQKSILTDETVSMPKDLVVVAFCTLKRMGAAVERRTKLLRERIDEELATLPLLQPGEKENRLQSGSFAVVQRNKAFNRKVIDAAGLKELLRSKRIAMATVTIVPEPPPPFISEDAVAELVRSGRLTQAEYDGVLVPAPAQPEVHVEVPDILEAVIAARLLGGIRSKFTQ